MTDPVTFAATVVGLFSRERHKDPLIAYYNVDATGQVRTQLIRESGRTGDRIQKIWQFIFTSKVDPAFTEYIRTGKVPTGNADILKVFNSVRPQLDSARASGAGSVGAPEPDFGGSDTPEDFRPIIRPEPGGPVGPSDFFDDYNPIAGGEQITPPYELASQTVERFMQLHRSIPGGAAGFAQQTSTGQRQLMGGGIRNRAVRRAPPRRVAVSSGRRKARKLKFGSPAWRKRYMKRR